MRWFRWAGSWLYPFDVGCLSRIIPTYAILPERLATIRWQCVTPLYLIATISHTAYITIIMGIYIIQIEGLPYLKIGKTKSLQARLATFRTGIPVPVIIHSWDPSAPNSLEKAYHQQWWHLHHRLEWFHDDPELRGWVETLPHHHDYGPTSTRDGSRKLRQIALAQQASKWLTELRERTELIKSEWIKDLNRG